MKFFNAAVVAGLANTAAALPYNITTTANGPIFIGGANSNVTLAPGPVIINGTESSITLAPGPVIPGGTDTNVTLTPGPVIITNDTAERFDQVPPPPPPTIIGPADPIIPQGQPFPHSCRRANNGFWYGWEVISPTNMILPGGDLANPGNGAFDLGEVCGKLWDYLNKASGCSALSYTSCRSLAPGVPGIHLEFTTTIFCSRASVAAAWDLATENRIGHIDCYRLSDSD